MSSTEPPNAGDVEKVVLQRLAALQGAGAVQETATVEWRDTLQHIPVISMPIGLLHYNPDTHRVRAQRSLDPVKNHALESFPYGEVAQSYLHQLLMGDPSDPSKTDSSFLALKEDLRLHGQSEPGIITRSGVLINGNTRRAALQELGHEHLRVGVLPEDAGIDDVLSIELSLQLRRDHKRDYSFMNRLLAIDERVQAGRPPAEIQSIFRIKATTFEQSRWILSFVEDAIGRSATALLDGTTIKMRLADFEIHQGKLEELYRAYMALKPKSPNEAEALREQRLLAIVFDKSKTDLRLIEPDFASRYMASVLDEVPSTPEPRRRVPGTTISAPGPSAEVLALKALSTRALQERAIASASSAATPEAITSASLSLESLDVSLDRALDLAGRHARINKKRLAAADRLSDASDAMELVVGAVVDARATGNFDPEDLDEPLLQLSVALAKLAQLVARSSDTQGEGLAWLASAGNVAQSR